MVWYAAAPTSMLIPGIQISLHGMYGTTPRDTSLSTGWMAPVSAPS